ncbi:BON domain-containing protein [Catenuloplanes japonicus]|uniref:BON domain-containing protein n=1 Tax=Catenuloplanes japonicus TaxID=33876 RepID=UPI00068F6937|nr:BON domain-containing protein [Catenuloplanes japonicus]
MATLPDDGDGEEAPLSRGLPGLDVRLTYQVAHDLLADDRTRRERIVVAVRDGVAILSGRTGAEVREVAGSIALRSHGVRDVCNRIDAPDTGVRVERQRFDAIVAGLVAESSRWDPPPPAASRTGVLLLVAVLAPAVFWSLLLVTVAEAGWWGVPAMLTAVALSAFAVVVLRHRSRRR